MPSLGNDLAEIRKEQNLTLQDIQDATKIPLNVLKSIEDDSIFSDVVENITYIRSFVRSYARVLNIDEQLIRKALDQMEADNYTGLLRQKTGHPKEKFDLDEVKDSEPAGKDEEIEEEPSATPADTGKGAEPVETPELSGEAAEDVQEPPTVRSVDWADMGRKFQPLQTQSKYWLGVVFILIVLLGGLFAFYYFNRTDTGGPVEETASEQVPSEPDIAPDSLQLEVINPNDRENVQGADTGTNESAGSTPQAAMESLPDTLTMVIYAAYDKLEPVRVYTDIMDNINPYWIEQGDAFRFEFVNTIRIRGQFSRMLLLFNGHPIENIREQFYNPETRLIEIDRSFFEGEPRWLQPPPDSLEIDAPPPNILQNRPTFN